MTEEMIVTFPGNKKVRAELGGFDVLTDQPAAAGGDGAALSPFSLFLVSLGTCAGYYALAFCAQRGIPLDGIRLVQRIDRDASGHLAAVSVEIRVPPSFPEKYREPIARAAGACAVKKAIEHPPAFEVKTVVAPA